MFIIHQLGPERRRSHLPLWPWRRRTRRPRRGCRGLGSPCCCRASTAGSAFCLRMSRRRRRGWWSGCGRAAASTLPRSREGSLRGETVEGEGPFVKFVMSYYWKVAVCDLEVIRLPSTDWSTRAKLLLCQCCHFQILKEKIMEGAGWENTLPASSSLTMISN